jgi:hypothetical protein
MKELPSSRQEAQVVVASAQETHLKAVMLNCGNDEDGIAQE